jgi:sugar phosphate isomerase/epimerase
VGAASLGRCARVYGRRREQGRLIALSTGSLYTYGTARVFELAARAGYDGVEVLVDHRRDTRQPGYLRRLVADSGQAIVALHSPFVLDVPGWPGDQLGRLKETVALAQELDVPVVVTHLPFRIFALEGHWHGFRSRRFFLPVPLRRRESYADFLYDQLDGFEDDVGITVAVENMPSRQFLGRAIGGYWFNTAADLERFPHLTLDTTHLATWGLDPLAVYRQLKHRVAHVHLSNYDGREHRSPVDGFLPLEGLLRHLAGDAYREVITVECHPDALEAGDEAECLAALRRAAAFCRAHLR